MAHGILDIQNVLIIFHKYIYRCFLYKSEHLYNAKHSAREGKFNDTVIAHNTVLFWQIKAAEIQIKKIGG